MRIPLLAVSLLLGAGLVGVSAATAQVSPAVPALPDFDLEVEATTFYRFSEGASLVLENRTRTDLIIGYRSPTGESRFIRLGTLRPGQEARFGIPAAEMLHIEAIDPLQQRELFLVRALKPLEVLTWRIAPEAPWQTRAGQPTR
jgi:hypothetical protein